LPCTVALALLDGSISPATHTKERYKDQDVLDFMGKIKIELPDEFADLAPETRCCRMTATLKNGETIIIEQRRTMADDTNGPSRSEIEGKFNRLTKSLLTDQNRQQLLDLVWSLDEAPSVENMVNFTQITGN
jgi:2-methylcitrate dehydratase PrpD